MSKWYFTLFEGLTSSRFSGSSVSKDWGQVNLGEIMDSEERDAEAARERLAMLFMSGEWPSPAVSAHLAPPPDDLELYREAAGAVPNEAWTLNSECRFSADPYDLTIVRKHPSGRYFTPLWYQKYVGAGGLQLRVTPMGAVLAAKRRLILNDRPDPSWNPRQEGSINFHELKGEFWGARKLKKVASLANRILEGFPVDGDQRWVSFSLRSGGSGDYEHCGYLILFADGELFADISTRTFPEQFLCAPDRGKVLQLIRELRGPIRGMS